MSEMLAFFALDALPLGVEAGSATALLGTWWGTGLLAPFRSALAGVSVLLVLIILPLSWRWTVALALWAFAMSAGALVGRWWAEASGIADDRRIAIDEVAGLLVALAPVLKQRWPALAFGTLLFGAIDKLKPWPVSILEGDLLPWSLGILLDDVAAGLVVAGVLAGGLALRRLQRLQILGSRAVATAPPVASGAQDGSRL